jgi:C-terminal processing protease CtpA/Prc
MIGNVVSSLTAELKGAWTPDGKDGEPTVGLIKIYYFFKNTAEQLENAVKELSRAGATCFVFDLRGCSEGTVEYACKALNLFVPVTQGNDVMATIHYKGREDKPFPSDNYQIMSYAPGGIAVLMDQFTAGPAELFIYNLQAFNLDKVVLVGQATKGLSTVQEAFPLTQVGGAALLSAGTVTPLGGKADWNKGGLQPGAWDATKKQFVTTVTTQVEPVLLAVQQEAMQEQNAIKVLTQPRAAE